MAEDEEAGHEENIDRLVWPQHHVLPSCTSYHSPLKYNIRYYLVYLLNCRVQTFNLLHTFLCNYFVLGIKRLGRGDSIYSQERRRWEYAFRQRQWKSLFGPGCSIGKLCISAICWLWKLNSISLVGIQSCYIEAILIKGWSRSQTTKMLV